MKMRAAVLYEQGIAPPYAASKPLVIEDMDLDGPGPGEILVRIVAAGLCHSDLSSITGVRPRPIPLVPGHEAAGVVQELGPGIEDLQVGDHVVMVFVASCGHCAVCYGGRANLCEASWGTRAKGALPSGARRLRTKDRPINHNSGLSVFAEYAVVSRQSAVRIPKDIPLQDAAVFGCAVVTGVGAVVNTARVQLGNNVAVTGPGGVGLSAVLGAKAVGAAKIIAIDVSDEKLALARQLGATHAVNARDPKCMQMVKDHTSGSVDHAFEMSGAAPALELAYSIIKRGGQLTIAGLPDPTHTLAILVAAMVSDERVVAGSYMGSCVPERDIPRFLEMYRLGRLPVDRLRTGTVSLDTINEGFDRLVRAETVRDILVFS